jgi:hypothetical protein
MKSPNKQINIELHRRLTHLTELFALNNDPHHP